MKNCSLAVAWMLVGVCYFSFASPESAAEDASKLPSVMVPPGTGASAQAAAAGGTVPASSAPAGTAQADPFLQSPGASAPGAAVSPGAFSPGPVQPASGVQESTSPAPGAGEAPRWTPPANVAPESNPGAAPPQTLPDVSDAKMLTTPPAGMSPGVANHDQGAAADAPAAAAADARLNLPSPPGVEMDGNRYGGASLPDGRGSVDMDAQGSGVNPAQYHGELPPPGSSQVKGAAPARLPGLPAPPGIYGTTAPASNTPPTTPLSVDPAVEAAAHAAVDLLKSSMQSADVPGVNLVALRQVLEHCPESDRAAVTQAYWKLSRAVCNGNWAEDELKRLNQIAPSQAATSNAINPRTAESPMLSAARAAAAARVTEAELETARAAAALQMSRGYQTAVAMRPSDVPLVGPYHTFYQQIFGSRPNVRAFQIDGLMPLRVKAINDWVVTVHSGTGAAHSAEQAHAQGAVDLRTVLACHDAVREHRRKFLEAVYQYNCDIAEYAALASPAGTTAEKYVGMLIPAKQPERLTSLPGRTVPQGAGGLRQLPAGQQQQPGANMRQLPWGDGWVPSTQSPPPQRLQTPAQPLAQPSYGATGQWEGSAGAGNNGAVAPPSGAGASPNRQADPFTQPNSRYGAPVR